MTKQSRYFLLGSAALLVMGLGGGLVAYFTYNRVQTLPGGLPDELRYVPASAELVAYAHVSTIMNSDLRRGLEDAASSQGRSRREIRDFSGIDLEKQVDHVVGYLESMAGSSGSDAVQAGPPKGLMLAQGTFDQARVEQFIREHGGTIEDYHGRHIAIYHDVPRQGGRQGGGPPRPPQDRAIGFVRQDLIAVGDVDLVRQALDQSSAADNVTANSDLMKLIREAAGDTVWAVGRFDAVSRRMGIPMSLRQQVPPLRLVSARAHVNGGVKTTIRADTADQAAADQVREVARGFISLIRLQAGSRPEVERTLKSIELGGEGNTVHLSFVLTPEAIRAIAPQRSPRSDVPQAPPPPPSQR